MPRSFETYPNDSARAAADVLGNRKSTGARVRVTLRRINRAPLLVDFRADIKGDRQSYRPTVKTVWTGRGSSIGLVCEFDFSRRSRAMFLRVKGHILRQFAFRKFNSQIDASRLRGAVPRRTQRRVYRSRGVPIICNVNLRRRR